MKGPVYLAYEVSWRIRAYRYPIIPPWSVAWWNRIHPYDQWFPRFQKEIRLHIRLIWIIVVFAGKYKAAFNPNQRKIVFFQVMARVGERLRFPFQRISLFCSRFIGFWTVIYAKFKEYTKRL